MPGIEQTQHYAINGNYSDSYGGLVFQGIGPVQSATNLFSLNGVSSGTQPIEILSTVYAGYLENSYFNDYYNRVWALPVLVSFGEVSASVVKEVFIWNAFLQQVSLDQITEFQTDNISLNGLALGQNLQPLQVLTPFFMTNEEGPESIDATYTFGFSQGAPVSIRLVGTRSEKWPFRVNWANPYSASYEYKTDELISRSGKVQRRAIRNNPRREIGYTSSLYNYETRKLSALMAKRQSRSFTITDDSCAISVENPLGIGQNTALLSYVPTWLTEGGTYAVQSSRGTENKTILSINGNEITWDAGYAIEHLAGAKIKKIVPALLTTDLRANRIVDGVANVPFEFEIPPGQEAPWPEGDPELLYQGLEVWTRKPNWINGLDLNYIYPREVLDYGRGINSYNYPINFGYQGRTFSNTCFTYPEIERVVNFFRRHKGRLKEFWAPTWESDFVLKEDILASSNAILIEGSDVFKYYEEDTVHRHIYIYTKSKQFVFLKILNISLQGSDTFMTFTTNFPQAINRADIEKIGWLLLSRFASDRLEISMLTDNKAQIPYPIVSLEVP